MFRKLVCILTVLVLASGLAFAAKTPKVSKLQGQNNTYDFSPAVGKGNFNEGFEGSVFPPKSWSLSGTAGLWMRSTDCSGYGTGTAAALADFYNSSAGTTQNLNTLSFFPASAAGDSVSFDHAYATYQTENDRLQIYTSTNGGTSWTSLILLNGGTAGPLNTGGATTNFFVPTAGQWATKGYALPVGTNMVRFTGISAYGNCLYVDNIRVTGALPDHDVQVSTIRAPGRFQSVAVSPELLVKNMGSNTETFPVFCRFDSAGVAVYAESLDVTSLATGDTQLVTFPSWTPAPGYVYAVWGWSKLATDQVSNNDTLGDSTYAYSTIRKPLGEFFTNSGCVPCVIPTDTLNHIYADDSLFLNVIRYHVWWPTASDPMWIADSAENRARNNYYANNYTPHLFVNGNIDAGGDGGAYRSPITSEYNTTFAPLNISLEGTYDSTTRNGTIKATLTSTGYIPEGNLRLRYAFIQDSVLYTGSNGEPVHDQVFRKMLPNTSGAPITLPQGAIVTDSQNFTTNTTWVKRKTSIVVMLQSDNNKKVLQSERIPLLSLLTGVEGSPVTVDNGLRTQLLPCYPNPSGGKISISYTLQNEQPVSLVLYDITGRQVKTLFSGRQAVGKHDVKWNGCDDNGNKVANGVYIVKMQAASSTQVRKLTLVR